MLKCTGSVVGSARRSGPIRVEEDFHVGDAPPSQFIVQNRHRLILRVWTTAVIQISSRSAAFPL